MQSQTRFPRAGTGSTARTVGCGALGISHLLDLPVRKETRAPLIRFAGIDSRALPEGVNKGMMRV